MKRVGGSTQSPQRTQRILFSAVSAFSAFVFVTACGKKGPPLPPLVKLPVPPADLAAERRGNTVDLQFTVPSTNTDGTRPANVARVDVYAVTQPATLTPLTDDQVLKLGTKVASLPVKSPRDPDLTAEPDDPDEEVEPPEGPGLDQGAVARVAEPLTRAMLTPVEVPKDAKRAKGMAPADDSLRPLLPPPDVTLSRTYVGLGVSTRGRHGPLSTRIAVPLVPPPPPPSAATIAYDESAITLTWTPAGGPSSPKTEPDVLPATPIGAARSTMAYNVYDVSAPQSEKLTKAPIAETRLVDPRLVWGEKRCYVVHAAEMVGGATIESDAPPAVCETLTDTFPPPAPKSLNAVGSEGAINLIWEPNAEKDLAGYIVLRAIAPSDTLDPITPAPIPDPSFKDAVQVGLRFVYAVQAVDKAGNLSPMSNRVEESAR